MPADPRKTLIIVKGEDHTQDVVRVSREDGRARVTYKNGKSYPYSLHNVKVLSEPTLLPSRNSLITLSGNVLSDVSEIFRFGEWVKIFHGDGSVRSGLYSEIKISRAKATDRNKDMVAYFKELAESISLQTEAGESLLAKKYNQLKIVPKQSVLSYFLKSNSFPQAKEITEHSSSDLIFPFGCKLDLSLMEIYRNKTFAG